MATPDTINHILDFFADCEEHSFIDMLPFISKMVDLEPRVLEGSSIMTKYRSAFQRCINHKFVNKVSWGRYVITESGLELYNENEGSVSSGEKPGRQPRPNQIVRKQGPIKSAQPQKSKVDLLKYASWPDFTHWIVEAVAALGYETPFTYEAAEDEDVHGIAVKGDEAHLIMAVRYDMLVIDDIRINRFAGEISDSGADKGVFITTSQFSREAYLLCPKNIQLIDGELLAELVNVVAGTGTKADEDSKPGQVANADLEQTVAYLTMVLSEAMTGINYPVEFAVDFHPAKGLSIKDVVKGPPEPESLPERPEPTAKTGIVDDKPAPGPLRIEMPGGDVIHEQYATTTMVKFINKVGPLKVAGLKLPKAPNSKVPLVTDDYKLARTFHGQAKDLKCGFYLITSNTTAYKAQAVLKIGTKLGLDLDVYADGKQVVYDPTFLKKASHDAEDDNSGPLFDLRKLLKEETEKETIDKIRDQEILVCKYERLFKDIRPYSGAPNKAVLMLVILDMISTHALESTTVKFTDDIVNRFRRKWQIWVGFSPRYQCNVYDAFFDLDVEPYWQFKPRANNKKRIIVNHKFFIENDVHAQISEDLFLLGLDDEALCRLYRVLESTIN